MVAQVVRIDVAKWRIGQALAPAIVVIGVIARRVGNPALTVSTFILMGCALVAFFIARRSFGRCPIRIGGGKLQVGDHGLDVVSSAVNAWTFDHGVARLYGSVVSWKLIVQPSDYDELQTMLARVFGKTTALKRRGSLRARRSALVAATIGALVLAVGIAFDVVVLAPIGVLCFVVGLATFGALSQKISA